MLLVKPCIDFTDLCCSPRIDSSFNGINRLVFLSLAELRYNFFWLQIFLFHQVELTCFIRNHTTCLLRANHVFHFRREHLHRKSGRAREILRHRAPATSSSVLRWQADFTDSTALLIDGWFIARLPSLGHQFRQRTAKRRQAQILHKQHVCVHVNAGLVWTRFFNTHDSIAFLYISGDIL